MSDRMVYFSGGWVMITQPGATIDAYPEHMVIAVTGLIPVSKHEYDKLPTAD